jgi:hypothetical protein
VESKKRWVEGENCGSAAVVAIRTIDGSVEAWGN